MQILVSFSVVVVCFIASSCKTRKYHNSQFRDSSASQTLTCRSTESKAIAAICISERYGINRSLAPTEGIVEALTKGAVDCTMPQAHRSIEFVVDDNSVALQAESSP